jgi:hypothetical protein
MRTWNLLGNAVAVPGRRHGDPIPVKRKQSLKSDISEERGQRVAALHSPHGSGEAEEGAPPHIWD